MYKDYRYINAGENEIYRYGRKAVARVEACLIPNDKGYYSIAADGGKYWTIGTSEGKYGEFAKHKDTLFSVNSGGFVYAKQGTDKGDKFVEFLQDLIKEMHRLNDARFEHSDEEEEEEDS